MKIEERDTIWLIDDAEIIHRAIKLILPKYNVHSFFSGEEFLEFIRAGGYRLPDLILLDILMKPVSGYQVLEKLMEIIEFREIPVVIISTNGSIDDKVKGLEMGAADYVVKPFHEKELSARIRVHIRIKKNQDALRKKVILDCLTSIYNKRHLYSRLKTHFNIYKRHASPISLIFFDIDNFKQINDAFGHLTGDYILKELCSEIKSVIRSEDELFRYGGEEFVIIVPYTSKANAEKFAEKIRKRIANKHFIFHEEKIQITLSFGVASLPEDETSNLETLMELADRRMIAAKKSGRNRVVSTN
jgi:diguanylate cyclase (GGDEF)-like protein